MKPSPHHLHAFLVRQHSGDEPDRTREAEDHNDGNGRDKVIIHR